MSGAVQSERRESDTGALRDGSIVYVVDDQPSFRSGMARMLKAAGYMVLCFETAEKLLDELPPPARGCILLDVKMPGLSGPDLQERLLQLGCDLPVIFMTGYGDIPTSVRAIKAGAEDFLTKPAAKETVLATIERALLRFDERQVLANEKRRLRARIDLLTPREREVLGLVVQGLLNKQIAFRLGTSERTIKAHRHSIMQKLDVRSVAELVSMVDRIERPADGRRV
jgi:FixJ family two-component response regulator